MFVSRFKMFSGALAAAAIIALPCGSHAAPLNSNAPTVALTATLNESLSVSTGAVNAVTFSLTNGTTSNGSAPVPITTTWVLLPSRATVKVYGYFANAAQALTDGYTTPNYITSTNVLGTVSGANSSATTASPFTATAPFGGAGAGLQLMSQAISGTNFVGNSTNNLSLQISTPATQPAGTYTGTLTIQAQAL